MQKLLLATDSFPYGRGEKSFILPELKRLAENYDITLLCHTDSVQTAAAELPETVRVICLGRPVIRMKDKMIALLHYISHRDGWCEIKEILSEKANRKERLYQSLAFYAQALADEQSLRKSGVLSKDENIIYYSFWYTYFCYSMVRMKSRYPNVRIFTRTHGHDLYHERIPGGRQPFRHQMERKLEKIVFACEYGCNYYEENVRDQHTDPDKLSVCRLGIEPAMRQMSYRESEVLHLLSCSNVIDLKRLELIIDGLADIEDIQVQWVHIGAGEAFEHVKQYAAEQLDGRRNISYRFMGYLENEAVCDYYMTHQIDCFITTSATEGGCPVSIQEAMSYGVPIIGTQAGGITEMIGGNGILLPENPIGQDVAEAISKMTRLGKEAYQEMQRQSLRIWEKEFDIRKNVISISKIIEQISASK